MLGSAAYLHWYEPARALIPMGRSSTSACNGVVAMTSGRATESLPSHFVVSLPISTLAEALLAGSGRRNGLRPLEEQVTLRPWTFTGC